MKKHTQQAGFTAVEVLVTLFVAALFIGGAHQIYGMVLHNSTENREAAVASNYAYQAMRHYSHGSGSNCSAETINANNLLPANHGLANPNLQVTINCPYGAGSPIKRVTARITYNVTNGTKRIHHAILTR